MLPQDLHHYYSPSCVIMDMAVSFADAITGGHAIANATSYACPNPEFIGKERCRVNIHIKSYRVVQILGGVTSVSRRGTYLQ